MVNYLIYFIFIIVVDLTYNLYISLNRGGCKNKEILYLKRFVEEGKNLFHFGSCLIMWKTSLKILISVAILCLLFHEVHIETVRPYLEKIYLPTFIAVLLLQFISSLIAAWRWELVMHTLGFKAPLSFYLKSYLKGVMFNQILPTSIGGDAYRIIEAAQLGQGKKEAFLGVLVDRAYGFVGLIGLNVLSLPLAYYLLPPKVFYAVVTISIAAMLGIIFLITLPKLNVLLFQSIFKMFKMLGQRLRCSVTSWQDFTVKIALSLLPNFLTVAAFFLLSQALNITGSLSDYLVIIPSVLLFTMIPISLAGWGVREGAMVFLGGLIGMNKPEALAISLLFGFVLILTSIPGLYYYFRNYFR